MSRKGEPMTKFNEAQHRRSRDGKFTDTTNGRIPKPRMTTDGNGFGGTGSRYEQTRDMSLAQVRQLILDDVDKAKANGDIPDNWKVTIKPVRNVEGFHTHIKAPVSQAFRPVTHEDLNAEKGSFNRKCADMMRMDHEWNGPEEFDRYCLEEYRKNKKYGDASACYNDTAVHAVDTLNTITRQYTDNPDTDIVTSPYTHHSSIFKGIN
jgi:hypothetical protein